MPLLQGLVHRGSFVMDPFVGTGSILVSAAHFGAVTLGCDIDIRVVLYGKQGKQGERLDVFTNFDAYKLPRPMLARLDMHRNPFRRGLGGFLDAIVCDPPYGVRAGGRKSHSKNDFKILPEFRDTHIPSTAPYPFGECLSDLLEFAARSLRMGGRLVFFLPWSDEVFTDKDFEVRHLASLLACATILDA